MDKKRKLFIHIGPHKTGSTYIQKGFVENRELLKSNGLYYPVFGQDYLWGHHNLIGFFSDAQDKNIDELKQNLYINDFDIIISSEDISQLPENVIKNINFIFEDCEIIIIAYLRLASRRIFSLWQELVKAGKTSSLPEYLIKTILESRNNSILNPLVYLGKFLDIFGIDSIKLISYDNLLHDNVDVFLYLFDSILSDYKDNYTTDGLKVNPSLPLHLVETIRLLNHLHMKKGFESSASIRNQFLKYSATKEGKLISNKLHDYFNKNRASIDITSLNYINADLNKNAFNLLKSSIQNYTENSFFYPEVLNQKVMIEYYLTENILFDNGIINIINEIYEKIPDIS